MSRRQRTPALRASLSRGGAAAAAAAAARNSPRGRERRGSVADITRARHKVRVRRRSPVKKNMPEAQLEAERRRTAFHNSMRKAKLESEIVADEKQSEEAANFLASLQGAGALGGKTQPRMNLPLWAADNPDRIVLEHAALRMQNVCVCAWAPLISPVAL